MKIKKHILQKLKKLVLILPLFLLHLACNKDKKDCWQGWDPTGMDVTGALFCNVTKAEAEQKYPGLWYYREGEAKYCYTAMDLGRTIYWVNIPVSIKEKYESHYGLIFNRVDCSSFCHCHWLEKNQSKLTGLYGPTRGYSEILLSPDTCSKLYEGRVIIFRETADSIITRELKGKSP